MGVPVQVIRLGVIGAVVGGIVAFKVIASNKAEEKIDQVITKLGIPKESISYDVSVDLIGLETRIDDVEITSPDGDKILIDEIVINDIDTEHKVPEYLDVEVEGFEIPASLLKFDYRARRAFAGFDKDKVVTNLALSYELEADDKELDIENFSYEIEDMAEFSLQMELHDVKSFDDLVQQLSYYGPEGLKVGEASFKYEDDGLAAMVMEMVAKQTNMDIEEVKKEANEKLESELKKAEKEGNKYSVAYLEALQDFVNNPQSFEVQIDPKEAVSMRELQREASLEALLSKVNASVSAN